MTTPIRLFLIAGAILIFSSVLLPTAKAQGADLAVTKLGPEEAAAGSNVTYTIVVSNYGPDASTTATLTDPLPGGTTFVSLSSPAGWTCNIPSVGSSGTVSCTNASFPVTSGDTFTLVVKINPATPPGTAFTNIATVSSPNTFDPNDENNSGSAGTTVPGPSADLGVTKEAKSDKDVANSDVTYTIQVINAGPDSASDARLEDTLPLDMTFVSLTQTSGPVWSCSPFSEGTIVCTNSSLPTGSSTFNLVGHIPGGTAEGTEYTNGVSVTSNDDNNPENDTAFATITVVAAAPSLSTNASPATLLGGTISDTATLAGGANATGTITFYAYGPDDTSCSGVPVFTSSVNVNGDGSYNSGSFTPTAAGTYRFVAVYSGDSNNKSAANACGDPNESVLVSAPTPTPTPTPTPVPTPTPTPARALNISTRLRVETGDKVMIGGFIITGNAPKPVVVRGIGPSLTNFGINDALLDPVLELRGANGDLIFTNDDWKDDQRNQIEGTIFQPSDDRESVILATLQPDAHTAVLTGKGETTGIGLVEIYDNDQGVDSQLGNISTRGFVQTQDNVMIGGFILGGNNNLSRVAVRALGPSLTQSGLSDVLADPTLELRDANGTLINSNDDWQSDSESAGQLTANGLALPDPKESGIFVSLPPGPFTAILAGQNGGIGIGLVEIYNLQ